MRVTLTSMHAAALAAPQAAADSVDHPYLLVSVVGPGARAAVVRVPETGQLLIHHGEVLRELPLTDVRLSPGDTVHILISLLEGATTRDTARGADSTATAAASTIASTIASSTARRAPSSAVARALASAFEPLVSAGARWLGSASLRLTDERGLVYEHGFECIETCAVLSGATDTPFHVPDAEPNVGAVELSGGRAKYHVQLNVHEQ